ncbi:MAG: DNA repair protein RecO [Oscillospiraceae bacterium]|nr:DNA repair protein RecO [Oscillospiraceae bacterium]
MANQLLKVNGVVLRELPMKESDKVITVLTRELGVISIYAKGAMRLKNKFHSSTGVFTYSEFVIFEGRGDRMYQLNEAVVKKVFYTLSESVENIALAMYMSELIYESVVPDEASNDILRLYLNCLHMLCEGKWSLLMTKAAFEMRLMSDIGFRPSIAGCKRCNEYEKDIFFFDAQEGYLVCPDCIKTYDTAYMASDPPVTLALRYFALADLEQMFTFKLKGYSLIQLSHICERYVLNHTKDSYKTLDFLKPLIEPLIEAEINSAKGN